MALPKPMTREQFLAREEAHRTCPSRNGSNADQLIWIKVTAVPTP
jgi:hypothetical protein